MRFFAEKHSIPIVSKPEDLAAFDGEADVAQGPELFAGAVRGERERFEQAVDGPRVEAVGLRDVLDVEHGLLGPI